MFINQATKRLQRYIKITLILLIKITQGKYIIFSLLYNCQFDILFINIKLMNKMSNWQLDPINNKYTLQAK